MNFCIMNCTDKLAKKLGFESKAGLTQYFELFPEVHTKIKQIYKQEYEIFYTKFTSESEQLVSNTLLAKSLDTKSFNKINTQVEQVKQARWRMLIDTHPYVNPVDADEMQILEDLTNKINF